MAKYDMHAALAASDQKAHFYDRIVKRSDYLSVRRGGKRRGKYFILEVHDRKEHHAKPRIGFTVTKKQGNAVIRNRIRRRLKEAIRVEAYQYMQSGHDYVLVGHNDLLKASFTDIIAALKSRFNAPNDVKRTRKRGKSKFVSKNKSQPENLAAHLQQRRADKDA